MSREVEITIVREVTDPLDEINPTKEVEITVTVGYNAGSAPRFHPPDPGEPDECWIEDATVKGKTVELDGTEEEEAVTKAFKHFERTGSGMCFNPSDMIDGVQS